MHSHEFAETPVATAGDKLARQLHMELRGLAIVVALTSIAAGISSGLALAGAIPQLTDPSVLALWLGGIVVTGLGAFLVERHRRMFGAGSNQLLELSQAAHRKDEFLASVSHELRTPLNVVLGYVDLLLDHSFGPLEPAQRDILHRIATNASNLSHLINDLVDLSLIDAGRMRIEMEIVDIEPLFADLAAVMEVLLTSHDVTFDADIAPGCRWVHADPDRLKQIVSNLLVNAVKFTERGTIKLRAESGAHDQVVVSVTDTGIGIRNVDQQAIFEPFRQVHGRERRAPGAGIGLAISSRLALLMGGTLGVESAPGLGSRFALVLAGAQADEPHGDVNRDEAQASERPPPRAHGLFRRP